MPAIKTLQPLIKVEDGQHSTVGASGSTRWMKCKGSNNLIRKIGDRVRKSGIEAALGTAAHTICQRSLEGNQDAWEYIGYVVAVDRWKFDINEAIADACQFYLDFVRRILAENPDAILYVEQGMTTELDDEAYGTADCLIILPSKRKLIIIDYKNGHVVVEPSSSQLKYYAALGVEKFMEEYQIEDVDLCIVQPNEPHPKGRARTITMKAVDVYTWFEKECVPAMVDTRDPEALLTVGPQCRFCQARDECPANQKNLTEVSLNLDPTALDDDEIGDVLVKLKALEELQKGLKAEALRRALQGSHIKNHKLVNMQAKRAWKGGAKKAFIEMADIIGVNVLTEPELLSPKGIEDLKVPQLQRLVAQWAFMPETGLTLAHEEDKRDRFIPLMERLDARSNMAQLLKPQTGIDLDAIANIEEAINLD